MRFRLLENIAKVDSEGNTLTAEQVNFFKDSKVRDKQGRLLVCYHGTNAVFNDFNHNYIGPDNKNGLGFYFTLGTKVKYDYTHIKSCYINIIKPLSIEYYDDIVIREYELLSQGISIKKAIDIVAKEFNTDGIIDYNRNNVVVFYPEQIKSITNKNPSSSSNINESKETQFLSDEQIKQFLSEIGNICWYSKSMCMDEACVYLESEFSINALWKANSIYIGDKRLLSIEFSHEGKNCWAVYQVHFYDNKKTYGVGDW